MARELASKKMEVQVVDLELLQEALIGMEAVEILLGVVVVAVCNKKGEEWTASILLLVLLRV